MNFTRKAHAEVGEFLGSARYVVDATCGCGRDALFGASLLSEGGRLFCFDVQPQAVARTRALLEQNGVGARASVFLAGHETMAEVLPAEVFGKINCFFFNLGWLPNSDKTVVTRPGTTLRALESALELADKKACAISVLCYKGHAGGIEEFAAVEKFMMSAGLDVARFSDARSAVSPELFVAKIGGAKK